MTTHVSPNVTTIFIGGLPIDTKYEDVREMSSRFGKTVRVFLQYDRKSSEFRGNAFIDFIRHDDALNFIKAYDHQKYRNTTLKVTLAENQIPQATNQKNNKPPSEHYGSDISDDRSSRNSRDPLLRTNDLPVFSPHDSGRNSIDRDLPYETPRNYNYDNSRPVDYRDLRSFRRPDDDYDNYRYEHRSPDEYDSRIPIEYGDSQRHRPYPNSRDRYPYNHRDIDDYRQRNMPPVYNNSYQNYPPPREYNDYIDRPEPRRNFYDHQEFPPNRDYPDPSRSVYGRNPQAPINSNVPYHRDSYH